MHLRLIAIIPPEPVFSEIRKEQEFIATTWGPDHALRTPPHITIIPPLSLKSEEVGLLYGIAEALSHAIHPFRIELLGYGSFKPRVIFINPAFSLQLKELHDIWLQSLKSKMPQVLDQYPDRAYHPHITLAHKDVHRPQFEYIWNYYFKKDFHHFFDIDGFYLLNYNEKGWEVDRKYAFDS